MTSYQKKNETKIILLICQQLFDCYKSLIVGGSVWLLVFNSLGYLTNNKIQEKELINQRWQQEKIAKKLKTTNLSKQKKLTKKQYQATIDLSKKIDIAEKAAKTNIDITYKDSRKQVAKMPDRAVALTFDDGPSPNTNLILNILKQYGAKATFFVNGLKIKYGCETLKRIYNEGHEIANHTYDHAYLPGKSIDYQKWQIDSTQKAIEKCLGIKYNTRWFRAPYGEQDSNTIKAARSFGLNTALWTIDTNDWRSSTTSNSLISSVIKSRGKDIVLMHDTSKKTANALENMIIGLNRSKIVFMTLSDSFRIEEESIDRIYHQNLASTPHKIWED